jgi:TolB-like protein
MRRVLSVVAALLALPLVAGAQVVDTRPVVAVLYFDNNSIGKDAADYAGMGKGIADLLITDLAANANVRVVDRDRVQALLAEQKLVREGAIDPETAVRLGKILGANHMITGGFMSTGKQMVLTARTIDVETSVIDNPQKVQQASDDVLALIGQLSNRLSTSMKLPPMERRTGDAGARPSHHHPAPVQAGQVASNAGGKPAKLDLRTALLYSKALEAQDSGDRSRAVELYNQVLDKFPNLETARINRDKLQASGD